MNRWRDLGIVCVILVVAAVWAPRQLGGPDLDRAATALALAGPAAGASLTLAAGRPNLAVGALAGVAAYVSAGLSVRGLNVPFAVLVAVFATTGLGAAVGLLTSRLDAVGLLASTLLLSVGFGALTQAVPRLSGGQAGLGPLPPLGTSLPGGRVLNLTAAGDLHALLGVALAATAIAVLVLRGRTGARLRAVGSDRARAETVGLRPLRAEVLTFAAAGGLAGLGGALGAHLNGVATPDLFAPDVVALPLLAALVAGRASAIAAVAAGVGTGLLGALILPDLGWRGPPSATGLALGLLAVGVVAGLLPTAARPIRARATDIDADAPWPLPAGGFPGTDLAVESLVARAGPFVVIDGLSLHVAAGTIHGLVGPNGAGKSSVLAAIAGGRPPIVRAGNGPMMLLPQSGGGFPACTVDETLLLAARSGASELRDAHAAAVRWRSRLDLDDVASVRCADLSAARRRLLDLARVMLGRPAVLLCDEPLAGLDQSARAAAVSLLRAAAAAGLTIVLAEHDRAAIASLATSTTELHRDDLHALATERSS